MMRRKAITLQLAGLVLLATSCATPSRLWDLQ
ncbi:MAG: hypothetical protein QOF51_2304 [Chloroflexota bacterium]|nr:hypothetical protein [Chloroflexota bacterium]